jgi:cell division septum initiation protein DivIVA
MAVTLLPMLDVTANTAVAERIADAERRLHAALLNGSPTRTLHAELAELRAAAARITAEAAAAEAEARAKAARAHEARVVEAAARYADDIARKLEGRLAALVPPPFSPPSPIRT